MRDYQLSDPILEYQELRRSLRIDIPHPGAKLQRNTSLAQRKLKRHPVPLEL